MHLLLATQRPNGVISDDIRANTNLRLALRLQDTTDALDVVGIATPATLPRQVPGRAVLRLGADDHVTFQTAHCTSPTSGRQVGTRRAGRFGHRGGTAGRARRRAHRGNHPCPPCSTAATSLSWPDPGGAGGEGVVGVIGLVDDPDHQQVRPLTWAPADGHVLVAGSTGSGVTSTLHTLALTAAADGADVYVIDARGDDALDDLAEHPRCGAVIRLHERERLTRLLTRLRTQARGGMIPTVHTRRWW